MCIKRYIDLNTQLNRLSFAGAQGECMMYDVSLGLGSVFPIEMEENFVYLLVGGGGEQVDFLKE